MKSRQIDVAILILNTSKYCKNKLRPYHYHFSFLLFSKETNGIEKQNQYMFTFILMHMRNFVSFS